MTFLVIGLLSFSLGIAMERTIARDRVRQAEMRAATRLQLAQELTRPLDLGFCEQSGSWQERP
jgi:hypothetical protein